jgi:hypothetical protein
MEDMESVKLNLSEKRKPNETHLDWLEAVEEEEQEKTQSVSYNGYGYHILPRLDNQVSGQVSNHRHEVPNRHDVAGQCHLRLQGLSTQGI